MKFGIFYEHQIPRPWHEDSEYDLLNQSLEQIELADRLGYDYAWEVEHHFLEEYSHSSAPEVFLGAASQRTSQIRLGHGIVQLTTNHPARVAERVSELFAAEVMPEFHEREPQHQEWKQAVLAGDIQLSEIDTGPQTPRALQTPTHTN
jgi:hypothetical protein